MDGIERRGRTLYMRVRVPARFAEVERRAEVNRSLRTRDIREAQLRFSEQYKIMLADWEARLANKRGEPTPDGYDAARAIAMAVGVAYQPMDQLLATSIPELIARLKLLDGVAPNSAQVPALLGAVDLPRVLLSEMPAILEEISQPKLRSKNGRQLRDWRNQFIHAAAAFGRVVSDKPVAEISERDAIRYVKHWQDRCDAGEASANYAGKQIRYVRQLIEAFYARAEVPHGQRSQPFDGHKIKAPMGAGDERGKPSFPAAWVKRRIIDGDGLDGLNPQARDIATIVAETGSRQAEILDLPADDIHLDQPVPHLMVRMQNEGPHRRQIKNAASRRPIVLLGASLDAMRRNPSGFDRYRGKKNYPATINEYLRRRRLFDDLPDAGDRRYTFSGTRHTYEDRMGYARIPNDMRAYMMGHSVGKVRGRPVYGSGPDLEMRSLLQEMVSYPTATWTPRPLDELWSEVRRLEERLGFQFD